MADRVIQRNDTAARWQSINPVLATGEIGIEIDGAKGYKIGDGKTRWNDLPYPANPTNVVQEVGSNENAVMSQKVVSEKLSELGSEVDKLNSDSTALYQKEIVVNPTRIDGYMKPDGSISTVYPGYFHCIYNVLPSEEYIITNQLGGSGTFHVQFVNERGEVIKRLFNNSDSNNIERKVVIVPIDSVSMVINSNGESKVQKRKAIIESEILQKNILELEKGFNKTIENINKEIEVVSLQRLVDVSEKVIVEAGSRADGFVRTDGTIITTLAGYFYSVYLINKSATYSITNTLRGGGVYHILFKDNEGRILSYIFNNSDIASLDNVFIPIPDGAHEMIVNSEQSGPTQLYEIKSKINISSIAKGIIDIKQNVNKLNDATSKNHALTKYHSSITENSLLSLKGQISKYNGYSIYWYDDVSDLKKYRLTNSYGAQNLYHVMCFNSIGICLGGVLFVDTEGTVIQNVEFNLLPGTTKIGVSHSHGEILLQEIISDYIKSSELQERIVSIENDLSDIELRKIEKSYQDNGFLDNSGNPITTFDGYYTDWYENIDDSMIYSVSNYFGAEPPLHHIICFDNEGHVIERLFPAEIYKQRLTDEMFSVKKGTTRIAISTNTGSTLHMAVPTPIKVKELKDKIESIEQQVGVYDSKLMKITIGDSYFDVRTKFDEDRDMIIEYKYNSRNNNISPNVTYLGKKELTNAKIKELGYCHLTDDSTPPFLLENYWYLFGEHGYYIATVTSSHNKTLSDVGSVWKSDNGIMCTLVNVYNNTLYLAPEIKKDGQGQGKDSRGFNYGIKFDGKLSHVSGGVNHEDIIIETQGGVQWRPFTKDVRKKFYADGVEVEKGEYYCDEFLAIDEHIGINPYGVTKWEPVEGNDFVKLVFSWKFTGLNVFCQHSIRTYYPMWLNYYGAFQPLGLRNWNGYKPMIAIPKVKERTSNGITTDWKYPQDCGTPNQTWASVSFSNTENELMKVDDMPERIIQFHQSENGYGIGFAAGYSLLSSDTVNSKRKELTKQCFQFSQDERNKLYIRCIDYNKLTNQVLPSNTVKQFNYYYSYFNPSESDAMVYHYREGNKIVVYIHVWEAKEIGIINLPTSFNGKSVSKVVEKTDGIELLTDTVTGNQMMFTSNEGANYLVYVLE